jgi:hypothetical protein
MVEVKELTYKKIHHLKTEQDKLIAEGEMEKPRVIWGLSPEGERALKDGIRLEDYIKSKGLSL